MTSQERAEGLLHKWEFLSSVDSACTELGKWVLTEYLFIDQKFQVKRMDKKIEELYKEHFESTKAKG